jgi:hypothetical protein
MDNASQALAINQLRHLWREGIDSGESEPLDTEDIKRGGRERLLRNTDQIRDVRHALRHDKLRIQ